MRATWLPDVLRAAGLIVAEVPGWATRGRELAAIRGVVLHDTVTRPSTSDEAVVKLLRDGRPDLAGPLSQLGLDRAGRFRLVAAGKSNHNGYGTWGNDTIGIEVFCAGGLRGAEEPWNEAQFNAAARGTAAILAHLRIGPGCAKGHKETDPNRKIDPWGVDMARFRAAVSQGGAEDLTDAEHKTLNDINAKLDAFRSGKGFFTDLTWLDEKLKKVEDSVVKRVLAELDDK